MAKETIHSLTVRSHDIIEKLIESDGALTPDLELMISDQEALVANKTDNLAFCLMGLENSIENLKAREAEVKAVRQSLERGLENFETRIKAFIGALGRESIEGPNYTLAFRKTPGRVVIENEALVPEDYLDRVVKTSVNKTKIKSAIDVGIEIPGVTIDRTPSLKRSVTK